MTPKPLPDWILRAAGKAADAMFLADNLDRDSRVGAVADIIAEAYLPSRYGPGACRTCDGEGKVEVHSLGPRGVPAVKVETCHACRPAEQESRADLASEFANASGA